MVSEDDLETWIWPERGVKPDPTDAVYSAGSQPISEYDNFWQWAVSKDIRTVSQSTGDHADTHEPGGSDRINLDGLSAGINTEPQITETDTPAGWEFHATETADIHRRADVTVENTGTTGVTDDITVTLYEGSDAGGDALVTETKADITVPASDDVTLTFIDITASQDDKQGLSLSDGPHYISVEFDADALSARKTTEYLYTGEWTLHEEDGDFSLVDHWGDERLCVDGETGEITCLAPLTDTLDLHSGVDVHAGAVDLNAAPITGKGVTVWDPANTEVPQPRLGGPASEISYGYPLDGRDMEAGEGSNINADLLRGYTPEDLMDDVSGKWNFLPEVSETDADASTPIDFDTGVMSTVYDIYRVEVYLEDHRPYGDGAQAYLSCRINNDESPYYTYDYYDSYCNEHYSMGTALPYNNRHWGHIASTLPEGIATHEVLIKCPKPVNANHCHHPNMGSLDLGAGKEDLEYFEMGSFNDSTYPVERIQLWGQVNATGRISVYGRNIRPQ